MTLVPRLAHELHVLVTLMERRADALLAASDSTLTYRRFLALLHVSEAQTPTQRELADRLGASEAATSRMVAQLAKDGLLDVGHARGNRRELSLTPDGEEQLRLAGDVLGGRFDDAVRSVGSEPAEMLDTTRRLVAVLRRQV